jgi:hypothetical protein
MNEKIWYEDIITFVSIDKLFFIIPTQTMSLEEKLNAIVRFFVYLGVILSLVNRSAKYLFLGILAALVSYPIYEFEKKEKKVAEKFFKEKSIELVDNKLCTSTNIENPFMNPSIADIQYNPDRPEACPIYKDVVADRVNNNFKERVFKDVTDIWGKDYSAREFYTVPATTIPNKQGDFAAWLYGTGATCKEGNGIECDLKNYRYILR